MREDPGKIDPKAGKSGDYPVKTIQHPVKIVACNRLFPRPGFKPPGFGRFSTPRGRARHSVRAEGTIAPFNILDSIF